MATKTTSPAGAVRTRHAQKPSPASTPAPKLARQEEQSVFEALLQRPRTSPRAVPATRAEGIAIGVLRQLDEHGGIWVDIDSLGLQQVGAVSMVQLGAQHIGQAVALGFEGADAQRPVVLGLMMQRKPATPMAASDAAPDATPNDASNAVRVTQQGRKVVIEAHSELELRCGEAVILLGVDGHIQIRGAYVTSHASASQRIRGGSVQIN